MQKGHSIFFINFTAVNVPHIKIKNKEAAWK